jgi:hypothetical protein
MQGEFYKAHFLWAKVAYFYRVQLGSHNEGNPILPEFEQFHHQQMMALFHDHLHTNKKLGIEQ